MKKNNYLIYIMVLVICLLLVSTLFLDTNFAKNITNIITIITAIIGAAALFIQFKRDKRINEVSFILNLSHHFYLLNGPKEVLDKLEMYRKGDKNSLNDDDYSGIVAYLEWLEELAVVVNQRLIDYSFIDDFLSYRFFLITNNEYVQKVELIPEAENYRGIYKMHKSWTEYKIKEELPILQEDSSLSKTENYNKV